jgi:hypothetical protein
LARRYHDAAAGGFAFSVIGASCKSRVALPEIVRARRKYKTESFKSHKTVIAFVRTSDDKGVLYSTTPFLSQISRLNLASLMKRQTGVKQDSMMRGKYGDHKQGKNNR